VRTATAAHASHPRIDESTQRQRVHRSRMRLLLLQHQRLHALNLQLHIDCACWRW
jgi:hypothetical protein